MIKGKSSSEKDEKGTLSSNEGKRAWARVVQWPARGSFWASPKLPVDDFEQ